jgi:predicted kinase
MLQVLYVLQGPPGSGKSKLAQALRAQDPERTRIHSTDDYFYDANKVYVFDATKLGLYHQLNLVAARGDLHRGFSVIVDNTNIKKEHARPYIDYAKQLGIRVSVIRVVGAFQNIHAVPPDIVERMRRGMEDLTELL